MSKKLNLDEVRAFIASTTPETKIYIGADSERYRRAGKWYADYTIAVITPEKVVKQSRHFVEAILRIGLPK